MLLDQDKGLNYNRGKSYVENSRENLERYEKLPHSIYDYVVIFHVVYD